MKKLTKTLIATVVLISYYLLAGVMAHSFPMSPTPDQVRAWIKHFKPGEQWLQTPQGRVLVVPGDPVSRALALARLASSSQARMN